MDPAGARKLVVLYFEESLEVLGLEEGLVASASSDACARRSLERADMIYVAELVASGAAPQDLERRDLLPQEIADFRYSVPCPCVSFEPVGALVLGPEVVPGLVLPADSERALLAASGRYWIVSSTLELISTATSSLGFSAGWRSSDGRYFVGTGDGRLFSGAAFDRLDEIALPERVTRRGIFWIDGRRGEAPLEVFFLARGGALLGYDEVGGARVLYDRPPPTSSDQGGGVAWVGPGRAIAFQEDGRGTLQYDETRRVSVELEEWPSGRGALYAIGAVETGDLLVGTRTGLVFRRSDDPWTEIPADPARSRAPDAAILGFFSFRGGFLAVGEAGLVIQHHPDSGFCPPQRVGRGIDLRFAVPLGERLLLGGSVNQSDEQRVDNTLYLVEPR